MGAALLRVFWRDRGAECCESVVSPGEEFDGLPARKWIRLKDEGVTRGAQQSRDRAWWTFVSPGLSIPDRCGAAAQGVSRAFLARALVCSEKDVGATTQRWREQSSLFRTHSWHSWPYHCNVPAACLSTLATHADLPSSEVHSSALVVGRDRESLSHSRAAIPSMLTISAPGLLTQGHPTHGHHQQTFWAGGPFHR